MTTINFADVFAVRGRFWCRVEESRKHPDRCWPWLLSCDHDGYGRFWLGTRSVSAHRVAYALGSRADVAAGAVVMHSCDNPKCCNPAHLRLGTQVENIADRVSKGRSARGRKPRHIPVVGI